MQKKKSGGKAFVYPQPLAESAARLMYLRVYDSRDSSRQPAPSPSLGYSLTHVHRSIGYRNRNPQSLVESTERLMYLRPYDIRDSSWQSSPSPSPCYPLTHAYRSKCYLNTLPVPVLLAHTYTQYPPHVHAPHDHMHSGTLVSWTSDQDNSFLMCDH